MHAVVAPGHLGRGATRRGEWLASENEEERADPSDASIDNFFEILSDNYEGPPRLSARQFIDLCGRLATEARALASGSMMPEPRPQRQRGHNGCRYATHSRLCVMAWPSAPCTTNLLRPRHAARHAVAAGRATPSTTQPVLSLGRAVQSDDWSLFW